MMQRVSMFLHKGSLCVCVVGGMLKWSELLRIFSNFQVKIAFITSICNLTAICLATGSGSGYFPAILVHTPTLSPVALQLPVEAILITAGDESPLKLKAKIQGEAALHIPLNTVVLHQLLRYIKSHVVHVADNSMFYEYK